MSGFLSLVQQLGRYFLVALASTLLDIATGWAILARLDGELAALWAASGGLIAGLILSFLLSRAFVFAKPAALLWVTLLRFCSVVLLVWLVRLGVMALVEVLFAGSPVDNRLSLHLPAWLYGAEGASRWGLVAAVAVSFFVSFFGHRFWTFRG